jgi:hypothetical protein
MLEALRTIAIVWLALAVTYAIIAAFLIATYWVQNTIRRLRTRIQAPKRRRLPK